MPGSIPTIPATGPNGTISRTDMQGVFAFKQDYPMPLTDIPTTGAATGNVLTFNGTQWAPAAPTGGSTTPGGSTGQLQYNNGGVFGGLTNTQLTADINVFTTSLSGAAPSSPGGTTNFLRADGAWGIPPGSNTGTVTTLSVANANGHSGTVSNPTTAPVITILTTVTGIIKGNAGTGVESAAVAGTDYLAPNGSGAALTNLPLAAIPFTSTYTASGAIAVTDARSKIAGVSGVLAMTLANGTVDGKLIEIKRLPSATATLTAIIDGTSQTITMNSTGPLYEAIALRWDAADVTYILM